MHHRIRHSKPHHSNDLPLNALQPHQRGIVTGLVGGHGLLSRMASLGFTPGAEVTMVQNYGRGPVIVLVRGGRVALGRGEARKIQVRTSSDG
jgi:ferrous iron transport protein A